jgi:hypothetical protein
MYLVLWAYRGLWASGGLTACFLASPPVLCLMQSPRQLYTLQPRVEVAGWTQTDIDEYQGPTPQIVSRLAERVRLRLDSTYTVCEVSQIQHTR